MLTNTTTYITALLQNTVSTARQRLRDESGQTAAEYLGVIVLIAAILAAIASTGIGDKLTDLIEEAIDEVFQSQD
jgi:pilus assembly protein Flp/PilA